MYRSAAILYLESEPQYAYRGVTFELSLRRSSVGHRDIREGRIPQGVAAALLEGATHMYASVTMELPT